MTMGNPFHPAPGAYPAHLAGRAAEQTYLGEEMKALAAGRAASNELLVYAPRGQGKTVLLGSRGLGRQAADRGVDYLRVSSREARTKLREAALQVAPLERTERAWSLQAGVGGTHAGASALTADPGEASLRLILEVLLGAGGARRGLVLKGGPFRLSFPLVGDFACRGKPPWPPLSGGNAWGDLA